MTIYNSDTNSDILLSINGVYCPAGETTMVPSFCNPASFVLMNYLQLPIENIGYTYEYKGDNEEVITETYNAMCITNENWISYGVIELTSDANAVLYITYSE